MTRCAVFQADFRLTPAARARRHADGHRAHHAARARRRSVEIRGHCDEPRLAGRRRGREELLLARGTARRPVRRGRGVSDAGVAGAMRDAGGAARRSRLLHEALAVPRATRECPAALDALNAQIARRRRPTSFAMLMFSMNWYAMLGDLDRAYAVERSAGCSCRRTAGFQAFRTMPDSGCRRCAHFARIRASHRWRRASGLIAYWRKVRRARSLRAARGTLSAACKCTRVASPGPPPGTAGPFPSHAPPNDG